MPSVSPLRGFLVVADTLKWNGSLSRNPLTTVLFPTPEGPEMTINNPWSTKEFKEDLALTGPETADAPVRGYPMFFHCTLSFDLAHSRNRFQD